MPEDGHGCADLCDMSEYLGSDARIFSYIRIGHEQRSPRIMRPRILRVKLSSQLGRDHVLKLSHILNRDKHWKSISISPWFQGEALIKSKALKQQCRQLNNDEPPFKNGKRQYVITRGRLMKRSNDDRLLKRSRL